MTTKGIVFDIEELGLHDGPGIRKLVFFKGCPLHCTWCHNPEGISFCKEWIITHSGEKRICGKEYEAKELAEKLLKAKEILIDSGGGITITGGEPLAQSAFLFELIRYLKPISIAIETSGYAPKFIFKRLISEVDLILMDLKHTDNIIHKKYTGVHNSLIINNLKLLCQSDVNFILRIPLIPGVNDNKENMESIVQLIKNAKNLQRVEFLPYHQTAGAKYKMVGKKFEPGFDANQTAKVWLDIFKNNNINVLVL